MRWKPHVRCEAGEKPEITSKAYLSLSSLETEEYGFRATYLVIAGYSLAGLFVPYCLYKTDIFARAANAPGSLWNPSVSEYDRQNNMPHIPERVYFSLGDKESHTRNKFIAPLEERTRQMELYFSGMGITTVYEANPGKHYHNTIYRMAKGIVWTLKEKNGNEAD